MEAPPEDVRPEIRCGIPSARLDQQPPWANCTLRITPQEVHTMPMPTCGPGRPVLNFPLGVTYETCIHDGWIYAGRGFSRRVRLSDGRVETLTPNRNVYEISAFWGCNSQGLLLTAMHRATRTVALLSFRDPAEPGRVVWHHQLQTTGGAGALGGLGYLRASDAFSFWRFGESNVSLRLYVASPQGENPRMLDTDVTAGVSDFALDGSHLVFEMDWDVTLYDHTTGLLENLTPGPGWQRFPQIEGTRVVYVDYRTRDPLDFDHGNVWLLDLTTRERSAITAQPAQPDAQRFLPVIGGDWVVWEDSRDETVPLPGINTSQTRQLYGYNLRARREVPLVRGVYSANYPLIVGDRLYYACQPTPTQAGGTYVMDLPHVD